MKEKEHTQWGNGLKENDPVTSFNDIHDEEPEITLKVDRVGVKGVKKKFVTHTPEGRLQYDVVSDAYVDVPRTKRGTHMSRDIEAFVEVMEKARKERAASLEEILHSACRRLLRKHPYASRAEITAKTRYQYEEDFTNLSSSEGADVTITTLLNRKGKNRKSVAVKVPGMTVCPCAQTTYHEVEGGKLSRSPSHTQRVDLSLEATTEERLVRMERLIDAARRAFSAPTVSLLKRSDEYDLIHRAFERPRFIEDLVRHALHNLYHVLLDDGYPEDTSLYVEAESYESIHPHNAYARRRTTLGELIEEGKEFERE